MKILPLVVGLLIVVAVTASASTGSGPLRGSYQIRGKTLIDPPEDEPARTHFRIFLTGEAARELYEALDSKADADECLGDGSKTKFVGGTACTLHPDRTYDCSLSINISEQRVESAYAC